MTTWQLQGLLIWFNRIQHTTKCQQLIDVHWVFSSRQSLETPQAQWLCRIATSLSLTTSRSRSSTGQVEQPHLTWPTRQRRHRGLWLWSCNLERVEGGGRMDISMSPELIMTHDWLGQSLTTRPHTDPPWLRHTEILGVDVTISEIKNLAKKIADKEVR